MAAQPLSVAPDQAAADTVVISAEELADARKPRAVPPAPHVTVVLPCYNEQDHVMAEIERISEAMDASGYSYELLAIDDKSTDNTLARLREAEATYPQLRVMAFRRNGGSGTARRIARATPFPESRRLRRCAWKRRDPLRLAPLRARAAPSRYCQD